MKAMKLIVNLGLTLILSATLILAFSRGPVPGVTGGFGEPTCNQAGCHASFELNAGRVSGLGDFMILGVPEKYEPGKTYPITVSHTHTAGRAAWGFQLTARASETGTQAGQLQPADPSTQVLADRGIQYIEHTLRGSSATVFNFNWVAPESATGSVTFHAAGNAGNSDSTPTGDYIYSASAASQPLAQDQQFAQIQNLPQIGVGGPSAGLNMRTTVFLINNSSQDISGMCEWFNDAGIPFPLLVSDGNYTKSASRVDWKLGPRQIVRWVLSSDSPNLTAGSFKVSSDRSIGVTAVFQLFDGDRLISQAGVLPSPLMRGVTVLHDSMGATTDTGVAFSNPNNQQNILTLTLFDRAGRQIGTTTVTLPPNGHSARFISDLFSTVPGVAEMEGSVSIAGTLSFSAVTLRLDGAELTTLPALADPAGCSDCP